MKKKRTKKRDGLVHLDPDKLDRERLRLGLSKTQVADRADVSRNTVLKACDGEGVFPKNAVGIAHALECDDVHVLLPTKPEDEAATQVSEGPVNGEWGIEKYVGPWITASNALQFRVCRMRHRFVESRLGRGKWYDLLGLSSRDRDNLRSHLVRHPTVCERIGPHPHVADNLSTTPSPNGDSWWVVDRWVAGTTLAEQLGAAAEPRPFPHDRLGQLMVEIARGLEVLHAADVVFRELAPSRVILAEADGRVVLTDFELAKLLDTGPTVSSDWPDDPYRAPEVEGGTTRIQSDLYSWARILLRAASGTRLPPKGEDAEGLTQVGLPKAVWGIAMDCLAPGPSDRPKNIQQVLKAIKRCGWH